MNCRDISGMAPLYFTGELEHAQAAAFSEHLRKCPDCRQELAEQSAFDERFRAAILDEPVDEAALDQRIRDIIHAAPQNPHRWKQFIAGIAAVLVFGFVAYFALRFVRPNPVALAAARDHRIEIVDRQPRKWLSDRAAIEALAATQELAPSVLSALTPAGYRLAQARLCYLDGQVFLHLVYESSPGTVSLYLRRVDTSASSRVRLDTFAAEHVAGFQHGRLVAVLVTDQPDGVSRLAQSAASSL